MLFGYDLFREIMVRRFWGRRPESKWRGALFRRLYAYLPQYRNPRYAALLQDFYRPFLGDDGDPHYGMAVRWKNGEALAPYLGEALRAGFTRGALVPDLEKWIPGDYARADDVEKAQWIEVHALLGNYLLSSQGDRMSMAHSVEGRYPYLDLEFVKFVSRLPRKIKLRGLKDKFILRHSFANLVPDEIRARPKTAYQAPDLAAFFRDGRMPDYVEELLQPARIGEVGLFDPQAVSRLVEKGRKFRLDRVGNRDNMAFVLILSAMLLDDIFVRGRVPVSVQSLTRDAVRFG
jgi:asparagine synthase (glutamine-hydrolysing)